MKKCRNKTKKKLPKYALGTMKPINLGYLPGSNIGTKFVTEEQNTPLDPETQAIKSSVVPNAINKVGQYGTTVKGVLDSFSKVTPAATSMANTMVNTSTGAVPFYLAKPEAILTVASNPYYNWGAPAEKAVEEGVKTGGSQVLNVGGKVLAGVGTAIGAYNMFNDALSAGDHRDARQMVSDVGSSRYTSEYGNQYRQYNSINKGDELAYEKANRTSKQLNFALDSIGTGASAGSFFGPIGTGIGAAAGAIIGGLGSLFGFGDNKKEVEEAIRLGNDNIALFNRQAKAVSDSKDIAAEFNARYGAKEGKQAYGSMLKYSNGKETTSVLQGPNGIAVGEASSLLAPGEYTYDPVNMTGDKVVGKGHEDTVPSYIQPNDLNIVFSDHLKLGGKSIAKHAAPMIKELERINKIIALASTAEGLQEGQQELQISQARQRQQELNDLLLLLSELQNIKREQKDMRHYKNGKLPKFELGTDYALSVIPHFASMLSSGNSLRRALKAAMPDYPDFVDSSANTKALDLLASRRYDPQPIIDQLRNTNNRSIYDINRTPGLGAGGQAIARANSAIQTNKLIADVMTQADAINKQYVADYAGALSNYGKWLSEQMTNNNYARAAYRQQQNAAREYYMDTYKKNSLTALADLSADLFKHKQYDLARQIEQDRLKIYRDEVDNNKIKIMGDIANQAEANRLAYNNFRRSNNVPSYNFPAFQLNSQTPLERAFAQLLPMSQLNMDMGVTNELAKKYGFYKCGKAAYGNGKGRRYVEQGITSSGDRSESITGGFFDSNSDRSTKLITPMGDTVYVNSAVPPTNFLERILGNNGVMRTKNGVATPEYLRAKQRHNELLNGAIPTQTAGLDALLNMFGFKCGKAAYKCGKRKGC